jgi:hypothetical protein
VRFEVGRLSSASDYIDRVNFLEALLFFPSIGAVTSIRRGNQVQSEMEPRRPSLGGNH